MFVIDEGFKGFSRGSHRVVSVLNSINEPKIAASDRPAEPTQAYIVMSSKDEKQLEAHVVLFLTQCKARIGYRWKEGTFPKERRQDVEVEALDFVEGMGFMMDNLNLERLNSQEKLSVLEEIPIFTGEESGELDFHEVQPTLAEFDPEQIPTQVKPIAKKPAAPPPEVSAETFDFPEAEFQRSENDFDQMLNSIGSELNFEERVAEVPVPDTQSKAELPSKQSEHLTRTLLRLKASF